MSMTTVSVAAQDAVEEAWMRLEALNLDSVMEFNRNRYFMWGVLLLLLGIQFRMVNSFVLNETGTRALAQIAKESQLASQEFTSELYMAAHPNPRKTIRPPGWLGWILLTAGGVMCLHAMVLPPPKQQ